MPRFTLDSLISAAISIAIIVFASIIHEIAHGVCALWRGDTTARDAGRLTLNPKTHIHPFGSIILPLLMAFSGGPVFGFANPVPYNPRRLKNPHVDAFLVAIAGPLSNLLQALVGTLLLGAVLWCARTNVQLASEYIGIILPAQNILQRYIVCNCALFAFNIVPLPPLDGASIISLVLPPRPRARFEELNAYALPILMIVLYVLPSLIGVDVISIYVRSVVSFLYTTLISFIL